MTEEYEFDFADDDADAQPQQQPRTPEQKQPHAEPAINEDQIAEELLQEQHAIEDAQAEAEAAEAAAADPSADQPLRTRTPSPRSISIRASTAAGLFDAVPTAISPPTSPRKEEDAATVAVTAPSEKPREEEKEQQRPHTPAARSPIRAPVEPAVRPISPLSQLLARTAASTTAASQRDAERESQREAHALRTQAVHASTAVDRAHRRALLPQMPDSQYPPAPVPSAIAGAPRALQASAHTKPWMPQYTPATVTSHQQVKAHDWKRVAPPTEAVIHGSSYERAAASFAQFLREDSRHAIDTHQRRQEPSRFSSLDAAERRRRGLADPSVPGSELYAQGLSDRARDFVKRAALVAAPEAAVDLSALPHRNRAGKYESDAFTNAAALRARIHNPAVNSILRSSAGVGSQGLSVRARHMANGRSAAPTQAPTGTGITRLQEKAAEESQRVLLLRLAWREREAEAAALAAGLAAAAADSSRLERHESEVLAVHSALQRREAAERRRLLSGESGWEAPPTQGEDAGFYDAFERERAARVQFERLQQHGVTLTQALEQQVLARGADCEAEEDVYNDPTASFLDSEQPTTRVDAEHQQYDLQGRSIPNTPRDELDRQQRQGEWDEKYPSNEQQQQQQQWQYDEPPSPGRIPLRAR